MRQPPPQLDPAPLQQKIFVPHNPQRISQRMVNENPQKWFKFVKRANNTIRHQEKLENALESVVIWSSININGATITE